MKELLALVLVITAAGGRQVTKIFLSEDEVADIKIHPGGTIISFPAKPTKVILGQQKAFELEFIENDVAIVPMMANANSQLFVYVLGRRFSFSVTLDPAPGKGQKVVKVYDRPQD